MKLSIQVSKFLGVNQKIMELILIITGISQLIDVFLSLINHHILIISLITSEWSIGSLEKILLTSDQHWMNWTQTKLFP